MELAEDQVGAALVIVDIGLLHSRMDWRLLRCAKARSHVHPFGAQRERGDEAAAIGNAAAGDQRDLYLVRCRGDQDQARNIVFARVARTFEPVDRNHVDALAFGRERVAHRRAFVENADVVRLEHLPQLGDGGRTGGFHGLDPRIDDRLRISLVVRRVDRREHRHVHAERLARHGPAPLDFVAQRVGGWLGQASDDAKAAGIRHCRCQLRPAHLLHAALNDGMLDLEQVRDPCLECHLCPLHCRPSRGGSAGSWRSQGNRGPARGFALPRHNLNCACCRQMAGCRALLNRSSAVQQFRAQFRRHRRGAIKHSPAIP